MSRRVFSQLRVLATIVTVFLGASLSAKTAPAERPRGVISTLQASAVLKSYDGTKAVFATGDGRRQFTLPRSILGSEKPATGTVVSLTLSEEDFMSVRRQLRQQAAKDKPVSR